MPDQVNRLTRGPIGVVPVVVISQTFPARPSRIPDIREFVRRCLAESPLAEDDNREVGQDDNREAGGSAFRALLDAAGPASAIQVCFRIFPQCVEADVPRSNDLVGETAAPGRPAPARADADGRADADWRAASFADWMRHALRREGLTREAAARQLGVSVKTVGRWVGGETEPRMRDLRRIREVFGELPFL